MGTHMAHEEEKKTQMCEGVCVSQSREESAKGMQRFFSRKLKCAKGYCLAK